MTNVVYRVAGQEHIDRVELSAKTVKRWVPDARIYAYTNQEYTGIQLHRPIIKPEFFKQPFMAADLLCVADWMMTEQRGTTLFIDSDVIIRDDISGALEGDWDLCLTWREGGGDFTKLQPYNFGVWWARHSVQSIWATVWMYRRCQLLQAEYQSWFGNQIAMRELVGPPLREGIKSVVMDNGMTLKVKMLDGNEWNYSPEEAKHEDVSMRRVVHLKGEGRKPMMEHYLAEALRA